MDETVGPATHIYSEISKIDYDMKQHIFSKPVEDITCVNTLCTCIRADIAYINLLCFFAQPVKPGDGKSNNSIATHRYTSAQVKLVLTFCAYGVSNVINYSLYSVVLKKEDAYSQALEHYFNCESMGVEFGKSCDRSVFEALDATPITFPLSTIVYIFSPLATLIYVANIDKFTKKYCKAKLRRRKQVQIHVLRKQLSQHS